MSTDNNQIMFFSQPDELESPDISMLAKTPTQTQGPPSRHGLTTQVDPVMLANRLREFESPFHALEESKVDSPVPQFSLQNNLFSLRSGQQSGLSSQNSSESLTPITPHSLSQTSLLSTAKVQPMIRHDLKDPRN